jgi:hypothetical protein
MSRVLAAVRPAALRACGRAWAETRPFGVEGRGAWRVRPTDIVDRDGATQTWQERIARTGPKIEVSGSLASASAAEAHQQVSNALGLDVVARDGAPDGDSSGRRSGVAEVKVYFDGNLIDSQTSDASCSDSCAVTVPTIEADADRRSDGDHTLKVTAVDRLGHPSELTWTVPILGEDYFKSKLAAWRTAVETKVDAVVPVVPLTGPMPALLYEFSSARAKACLTDTTTMEGCDGQIRAWGADVRAWFAANVAVLAQILDTLPDMPDYTYAEDDYARRYVAAAVQEFRLAKKLNVDPAALVDVRLNLKAPVNLTTLTTALGSLTGLRGPVSFRGILSNDEQPIVAEQESDSSDVVAAQAEQFYATWLQDIDEDISDFTTAETDPDLDPDEQAAAGAERAQLQQVRSTVVDRGPLITSVGIRLPVLSVLAARLSGVLDVINVELPVVDVASGDVPEPGTEQMTAAEYIANRLPGDLPPSGAGLRSTGLYHRGQTCLDRQEFSHASAVARRNSPIPGDFMPSRHRLDSYVVAGASHKAHTLRWMWAAPKSLQWFCGAAENRRGFEEEVRVPEGASQRWSTNWHKSASGYSFRSTNLPGAVPDDLACGTCFPNPFVVQPYPDFSLISVMGQSFRYGKWYYAKFRTNAGDTSDPDAVVRYSATATGRAEDHPTSYGDSPYDEADFCLASKLAFRSHAEPASCQFSRKIVCLSAGRSFRAETLKIRHNFRDDPSICEQ